MARWGSAMSGRLPLATGRAVECTVLVAKANGATPAEVVDPQQVVEVVEQGKLTRQCRMGTDHVFRQSGPFFRQPPDRQRGQLNMVWPHFPLP